MKFTEESRGEFMKKQIRYIASLVVLLGVLGVIGVTTAGFAQDFGKKCNCRYTSGDYGVIENNDCKVQDCWLEIT
jgi:hypothetical protein